MNDQIHYLQKRIFIKQSMQKVELPRRTPRIKRFVMELNKIHSRMFVFIKYKRR